MARRTEKQRRADAAQEAQLLGAFILWSSAIQDMDGVILVTQEMKPMIQAAGLRLFAEMRARTRAAAKAAQAIKAPRQVTP